MKPARETLHWIAEHVVSLELSILTRFWLLQTRNDRVDDIALAFIHAAARREVPVKRRLPRKYWGLA